MDNEKASDQGIPGSAARPTRGQDWTRILGKAGLEAPGYHETIDKMKREGRLR